MVFADAPDASRPPVAGGAVPAGDAAGTGGSVPGRAAVADVSTTDLGADRVSPVGAGPAGITGPGGAGSVGGAADAGAGGRERKTFDELFVELAGKWRERSPGSGTVAALDQGVHHLGKKLVEEAAESWMAAEYESRERAAEELSQLLYWTQLMMISLGLSLDDVYSRL